MQNYRMIRGSRLVVILVMALVFVPGVACAQTAVSIELVLAVDTSASVDNKEYELQMRGIAKAFRSPKVIHAIESTGGIAVMLVQWSSWANTESPMPWRMLNDRPSILSFAAEVESSRRAGVGNLTGIGTAIGASLKSIEDNRFAGRLRKIDISGDGLNNSGLPLVQARNLARSKSVTINALAIQTDFPNLATYFREHVISGPDAFVVAAVDYEDFARAMRIKLVRELTTKLSGGPPPGRKGAMLQPF